MNSESSSSRSTCEHRCPTDTLLGLMNVLLTLPKPKQADKGVTTASEADKAKKSIKHRPLVKLGTNKGANILFSAFCADWPTLQHVYGQRPQAKNKNALIRKCLKRHRGWENCGNCDQCSTHAIVRLVSLGTPQP